jgi:hypothetical protein
MPPYRVPAKFSQPHLCLLSSVLILHAVCNFALPSRGCFVWNHELHLVPPDEENDHPSTRMPWQNLCLDSWMEQEAYGFTSFTKDQLNKIYHHFGLAARAAQNDGAIPVPTGANHGRNYHFHPEELFSFMMTKCKTGFSNKALCDLIFGGHSSWWSFGYPWILAYLDDRYSRTLSHEKLCDYVHLFPEFYQKNLRVHAEDCNVSQS